MKSNKKATQSCEQVTKTTEKATKSNAKLKQNKKKQWKCNNKQQKETKSNEKATTSNENCHLSLLFVTFPMFFLWCWIRYRIHIRDNQKAWGWGRLFGYWNVSATDRTYRHTALDACCSCCIWCCYWKRSFLVEPEWIF